MMKDEVESRRLAQIERRLNEIGSAARGQREFAADRLSDVIEQVDEIRQKLATLSERVERMAEFLNKLKRNGGGEHP